MVRLSVPSSQVILPYGRRPSHAKGSSFLTVMKLRLAQLLLVVCGAARSPIHPVVIPPAGNEIPPARPDSAAST